FRGYRASSVRNRAPSRDKSAARCDWRLSMRRIGILSALICFISIPSVAYACVCPRHDPPQAFNDAKAVFIGEMLGGTEQLSAQNRGGRSYTIEAGQVRFAVEEVFKGSLGSEATIEVASMQGTSCGPYGLKRGERYIVYAYAAEQQTDILHSGVCTRTAPVDS